MATIEPRLIHLLNEATTPQLAHNDLPPLSALPYPPSNGRPLPPIDSDSQSHRFDRSEASLLASYQHREDDHSAYQRSYENPRDGAYRTERPHTGVSAPSLQSLLSENPNTGKHHRKNVSIDSLEDGHDEFSKKKRSRAIPVKDDFVQLPQPMKKQKAAQQSLAFPPIINGLHEPPPHAALFPPIAPGSLHDTDPNQVKLLQEMTHTDGEASHHTSPGGESEKSTPKARKRAAKPRRKWTEEETNQLLLGVSRHGVGKWTSILEDSHFKFNGRTAGDLKDRFRTCCPEELRSGSKHSDRESTSSKSSSKSKGKTHLESILIDQDEQRGPRKAKSPEQDSSSKSKRSRAHRKNLEDLAELGIHGPFKKSHRRERRPFTEQDDREILEGLDQYGPAWTKIQRDPRFHLSSRQPTDLRDRVRNKYPQIYSRIEKGTFLTKEYARTKEPLEPSIHMSVDYAYPSAESRVRSTDNLQRWPGADGDRDDHLGHFDYNDTAPQHNLGGEMDISRLLLDDSASTPGAARSGAEDASGYRSPSGGSRIREEYLSTGFGSYRH